MIRLATLLGYGDNLISLSLLERLNSHLDIQVVGTQITTAVCTLMSRPPLISEVLLPDVASFYTLRQSGLAAALRDSFHFRRWADQVLRPNDTLIVEKKDIRNQLLLLGHPCRLLQIERVEGAYLDRQRTIENLLGKRLLERPRPQITPAQRIVINPSARARDRHLPKEIVEQVQNVANGLGLVLSVVDTTGSYDFMRGKVDRYLYKPTLLAAAAELRAGQRYIGPDSFFMHLAFYYGVPHLGFFWPHDTYFAPPGTLENGSFYFYSDISNATRFEDRLTNFLLSGC